jgi:DNA-binding beta-propeller fold protein YncE
MFKSLLATVATAAMLMGTTLSAQAHTRELWMLGGFSHPESVELDISHQVLYVSNVGGTPLEKDGNGFISKVSRDGKLQQLKWIEGLNAPKGMVINGFKLYVSDIDNLIEIDTRTGRITNRYPAAGAVFLNDTAVDKSGNVYVSDIAKKKIWQLKDGKMSVWYEKDDLMHSNGLRVIYGNKLLVAGWGKDMQDDGSTKVLGNLFTIDLTTKELKNLGSGAPIGNLDGLERDAHGNFLVTDFLAGSLMRINKDGSHDVLMDLNAGSADLDVINKGHTAVVPVMMDDNVRAFWVD